MSIPVVRLPSMDLIRSFVAVGRRMSMTLASEDLSITQSAVSRQIHALEQMLGVKLLVRSHRAISFTPEGERLFWVADTAVRQLQDVVMSISAVRDQWPVTISTPVGFAGLWLLPRMTDFQQRHPDIDLHISANARVVDLRAESIDLAIRYCAASAAPEGAIRLFGETVAPVAHPSLREDLLERPEQISQYFLLEFDDFRRYQLQWKDWLNARGWKNVKPKGVLRFNQYDQVIQAALAGQGIALGRLELLGTILGNRQLVPLATPLPSTEQDFGHWLVQGDQDPREDVQHVIAWIREKAAEMATSAVPATT